MDQYFNLDVELTATKHLLPCCGKKMHIVGYSYGGVLGLHLALSNPVLVHSLTLTEPVFFTSLRYAKSWQVYQQFCRIRDRFNSQLSEGHTNEAMSEFIDFWTGEGTWLSYDGAKECQYRRD